MSSLDNLLLAKRRDTPSLRRERPRRSTLSDDLANGRRLYRPYEPAIESGIYEVIHHGEHRERQTITIIGGEIFPDCDTCKDGVRYDLVHTAPYIFHDSDFSDEEPDAEEESHR